jgi:pyrroloquinoline-quinone synthase
MTLISVLDQTIAERRLLDHPFYQAWAMGSLTRDDLSFYAGQYWRQVEAFPEYLQSVHHRMPAGEARDVISHNLADERDDDHPGLWRRFARELGCVRLEAETVEPETMECVEAFRTASETRPLAFVLGMLYAYESQTPDVAKTKIEGLRKFYGIDGEAIRYFELHGELDVEHARELGRALDSVIENEADEIDAVEGARSGAAAIYGLLDGVARVRNIAA